jgi:hypothetical protein
MEVYERDVDRQHHTNRKEFSLSLRQQLRN